MFPPQVMDEECLLAVTLKNAETSAGWKKKSSKMRCPVTE
jgi:hypothetical protein